MNARYLEHILNWYDIYHGLYQKGDDKFKNEAHKQWCIVMSLWETHDIVHRYEGE